MSEYWDTHTPWTEGKYEDLRKERYRLQNYMEWTIPFESYSGKKVLDLGCGGGIDSAEFARYEAEVTAVDVSKRNCDITEAILSKKAIKPYRVITHDLESENLLPFGSDEFDLVYCFGVLHHLKYPLKVLLEAYRVLKKGGEMVAMVYNRDSLLFEHSILCSHLAEYNMARTDIIFHDLFSRWVGRYSEREPSPFTYPYTKDEVAIMFGAAGFTSISVESYYRVIDLPDKRKVKFLLETPRGGEELGWHLIVKAKKE